MDRWQRQELAARARWAAGIVVVALAVVFGTMLVAQADGFQWPNGGQLADHVVVQTPDGSWEVHPARCAPIFEDGSSYGCPDWDGNPGADEAELKALAKRQIAAQWQMQKTLVAFTAALMKVSQP